jgi:hypothetical protein
MIQHLKMFGRYAFGLPGFLNQPLSSEDCRGMIKAQLHNREKLFLRLLEKGIYNIQASPYRRLLAHAGVELGDISKAVTQDGIEATMEKLYRQGVYIDHDEFKGRRPIRRGNLMFAVKPADFDNPLLSRDYEATTGGSRGPATRVVVDYDLMVHEAAYHDLFETCFDLHESPLGMWRPVPPAVSGIRIALKLAKLGRPLEKWFSQNPFRPRLNTVHYFSFAAIAVYGSRFCDNALPMPEFVPAGEAWRVAQWLRSKREEAQPAVLLTPAASAVRVCQAALEGGLDISGSLFRVGGEPYTPAKANIVTQAGCRAVPTYATAEIGNIGLPCAAAQSIDDIHLLEDKLAVIQQPKTIGDCGLSVGALFYTALLTSSPKIMLNVDTGDYAIMERRKCDCALGQLGFHNHLREIRSYDKLTSEGMTFMGSELIRLIEEILPQKFGGYPTDYQFVEEEEEGLPLVQIRVSPRVGDLFDRHVVDAVLEVLRSYPGAKKMMAERWRDSQTLRVVRAEPYSTFAGKTLPLHILDCGNHK